MTFKKTSFIGLQGKRRSNTKHFKRLRSSEPLTGGIEEMNRRVIAIALLCVGISALAFGLAIGQHELVRSWLQVFSDAYAPYFPWPSP